MRELLFSMIGAGIGLCAATASGFVIEYRVVERVNGVNYVIPDNHIDVRPNSIHRYRLQFRVVPSGPDEALAGFLAWNMGVIDTTGGLNYRTGNTPNPNPRGRVAPYTWAPQQTADGVPFTDPFTRLTQVDCVSTNAAFAMAWACDGNGNPLPEPMPQPHGRGNFVSVYEVTSGAVDTPYTIRYSGQLVVGDHFIRYSSEPPDCGDPADPSDDVPSVSDWRPIGFSYQQFSLTLTINVCPAEWNEDGRLNSQDMFDYLTAFFANDADFNGDGMTNTADIYGYIDGFFAHCN